MRNEYLHSVVMRNEYLHSVVIVGGAEAGWYVTVIVKGVPRFQGNDILVLTSLLPHEHR